MNGLRKRLAAREPLLGTWCSLGSSITVEMAGIAGFDWVLLDQEHGPGDNMTLLHQLQALGRFPASPVVRIGWADLILTKRALDLGAAGIMFPYIQTGAEAERAVSFMQYPHQGIRGLSAGSRCSDYGANFQEYRNIANEQVVCVTQIETAQGVENAAEIAGVPGVDVLFVGPLDLSASLNTPKQFDDPAFVNALRHVSDSARAKGKATGILVQTQEQVALSKELGITFIAIGTDAGAVLKTFQANLKQAGK